MYIHICIHTGEASILATPLPAPQPVTHFHVKAISETQVEVHTYVTSLCIIWQLTATHCNSLQHTATNCNLQCS